MLRDNISRIWDITYALKNMVLNWILSHQSFTYEYGLLYRNNSIWRWVPQSNNITLILTRCYEHCTHYFNTLANTTDSIKSPVLATICTSVPAFFICWLWHSNAVVKTTDSPKSQGLESVYISLRHDSPTGCNTPCSNQCHWFYQITMSGSIKHGHIMMHTLYHTKAQTKSISVLMKPCAPVYIMSSTGCKFPMTNLLDLVKSLGMTILQNHLWHTDIMASTYCLVM